MRMQLLSLFTLSRLTILLVNTFLVASFPSELLVTFLPFKRGSVKKNALLCKKWLGILLQINLPCSGFFVRRRERLNNALRCSSLQLIQVERLTVVVVAFIVLVD